MFVCLVDATAVQQPSPEYTGYAAHCQGWSEPSPMAIEGNVADRRLHDGSRSAEQDDIIWGTMETGCTKWRYANTGSSIVIRLSVCSFHGDGSRGGLGINTDGEYWVEPSKGVHVRIELRGCCRIITQGLYREGGGGDDPRGRTDDAYLVQRAR